MTLDYINYYNTVKKIYKETFGEDLDGTHADILADDKIFIDRIFKEAIMPNIKVLNWKERIER